MTTNREQVQEFNAASLGYWAAHEQYSMHDLLRFVVEAEKNGFTTTTDTIFNSPRCFICMIYNAVWPLLILKTLILILNTDTRTMIHIFFPTSALSPTDILVV
jgi:hypothetical protein